MDDVNDLHEHLKNLIEKSSIPWTYGILWECSSQRRVLKFKDGYHRGSGKGKPKQVGIMGSCFTFAEHANDYDAATEWFFKTSMNQYFEINEDLPGHALIVSTAVWINAQDRDADPRYKWGMWERTKWAHNYGIRTFLCIPLKDKRVLELTSTEIIPYCIEWIQHNVDLIHPIGTPSSPVDYPRQQEQQRLLLEQQQLRQLIEQQQTLLERKHEQLRLPLGYESKEGIFNEMKNRGEQKISDSKCSWTILTDSSDIGTDRTFSSHDYSSGPS